MKKHIAETAYNVGYSAKLHFASYEMIERLPGLISFFSMAFGIYALAFSNLSTKFMSCALLVLGLIGLYVSMRNGEKANYKQNGDSLMDLFNELKHLMSELEGVSPDIPKAKTDLKNIEIKFNQSCAPHQIMFASWLAHYKFFWEQQIAWIDEQRKFGFFRDKVPLTFWISLIVMAIIILLNTDSIITHVCEFIQTKGFNS